MEYEKNEETGKMQIKSKQSIPDTMRKLIEDKTWLTVLLKKHYADIGDDQLVDIR